MGPDSKDCDFKYRGFISYSHRDKVWADWLHGALERYRVPKALVGTEGRDGPIPQRLFPIYRDRAETPATADLQDYVQTALRQSACLIVICSPHSRSSRWVNQEILNFKRLGREDRIFALIVGGEPNDSDISGEASALECFPDALRFRLGPDGRLGDQRLEPAAADARPQGDGKENAKLKLIAGMLGADYGALKQRDLEYARRRTRIYGAIALFMTLLAVLAVAGGGFAYYYALRSQEMTRTAQAQTRIAEKTTSFMVSLFTVANPEENQGEKITAREMLDRGVAQMKRQLTGENVVRTNLLRAMGEAYSGLGLYPKATSLLQSAVDTAKRGGSERDLLKANLALAWNDYANGNYAPADKLFAAAVSEASRIDGPESASVADALNGLGNTAAELGRDREAERNYRRALAINLKLFGEKSLQTADTLNALATLLYADSRFAEAEGYFRRALATRKTVAGPRDASVAVSLNNLGALEYQTGNYVAAEALYNEAVPVYRAVYGREHPQVAVLLNNLGRLELILNKLDAGERTLSEALAMDRRFLTAQDETLIPPLNSLGMIALYRGDIAKAEKYLEEARVIAVARKSPLLEQVLGNCSELYMRLGKADEAAKALQGARVAQTAQYGAALRTSDAWRAAVLDVNEASGNSALGHDGIALQQVLGAVPVLRARFGNDGFFTQKAIALAARLYQKAGDRANALGLRKYITNKS
jgi:tetratricopeptide (TPR) repeat protein